jgi:hypothetical protein
MGPISNLTPGVHLVQAHFSGDVVLLPADGASHHTVQANPGPDMFIEAFPGNPSTFGEDLGFRVSFANNADPKPTGSVQWYHNGVPWGGLAPIAGVYAFSEIVNDWEVGSHLVGVQYYGDLHWAANDTSLTQVIKSEAIIDFAIVPNPVRSGDPIDFWIRVRGGSSDSPTPTGDCALFLDDVAWGGAFPIDQDGMAHLRLDSGMAEGEYDLYVAYEGDSNYDYVLSYTVHLSVTVGVTALTLEPYGYALPFVVLTDFANGGGNLHNLYRVTTDGGYTGRIRFVIPNGPWATLWNVDPFGTQVIYNGPLSISIANDFYSALPYTGPVGYADVVDGVGTVIFRFWAGGLAPNPAGLGGNAVGHIWLQADVGGNPVLINGVSTYVLELSAEP